MKIPTKLRVLLNDFEKASEEHGIAIGSYDTSRRPAKEIKMKEQRLEVEKYILKMVK